MAAPSSAEQLLGVVRQSGLVSPERLKAVLEQARAAGPLPTEPKPMAGLLVRAGLITYFYAEQFLRGVYRGFTIGKYRILERIGTGGMGIVYLGQHKMLENRVAIKVLPLSLAEHPWFRKRFYKEAQAVAALDHPNIVRATDMDEDGKLLFLVMEFVDGSSLQDIAGKYGAMPPLRAANYIRQAAEGLQHLHEVGLVHRDIKPGNLLLDSKGTIKIIDLGLGRFFEEAKREVFPGRPHERAMVGTDDYLAPEQIVNSDDVDVRADIYSLGATFYFLLTGCCPFESEERAYHKLIKHLAQKPKGVRELKPDVPPELAAVCEKMMAKNPWQRYQMPAQVVAALEPWTRTPIAPPPAREMPRWCPALKLGTLGEAAVPAESAEGAPSSAKFEVWRQGSPSSTALPDRFLPESGAPPTANGLPRGRTPDTRPNTPPSPPAKQK